jgi:hypothetical protein
MIFYIGFRRSPWRESHHHGAEDFQMAVSQAVAAFCDELRARVPAAIAAATAPLQAQITDLQAKLDAATAAVQTDATDEAAALESALNEVAPGG